MVVCMICTDLVFYYYFQFKILVCHVVLTNTINIGNCFSLSRLNWKLESRGTKAWQKRRKEPESTTGATLHIYSENIKEITFQIQLHLYWRHGLNGPLQYCHLLF